MFKKISAFFFFYFAVIGVYIIFLPKILSSLGYSFFDIGIIFAVAPLVRFVLPFVFERFFPLNKKLFYFSLANLVFSGFLFYPSINNFYAFFLINVFFGASIGIILPYIESFSLKFLGKYYYGKSRLFGSFGFMFIALVLPFISNEDNTIFFALCSFMLSTVLTVIFACVIVVNNDEFSANNEKIKQKLNFSKHIHYWLSLFLMQVSFGAFYNFFTIYESSYGFSLSTISYLWTFGVICEIVWFYFQAPLFRRFSLEFLISFSYLVVFVRWLILYLFPSSLGFILFSQSLHAISFALFHTAAFSYLHIFYKNTTLASQFYYGISYGLGAFVGSLISGACYGRYVYLVSAITALLSFAIFKSKKLKV